MSLLVRRRGKAFEVLHALKQRGAFRHWRLTCRGKGSADRLLLGVGQIHPVLTGKFAGFQARRIADTQREIFDLCRAIHGAVGVRCFGQEGLAGEEWSMMRGQSLRWDETLLREVKAHLSDRKTEKRFLREIARRWRKALARGDDAEAGRTVTVLNGLTLLQALEPGVSMFPIEQAAVHGAVGEAMAGLELQINAVETSPAYRSAVSKGGRGLTREEYGAAVTRHALVKQWSRALTHPERDRAIFREVVERHDESMTVFILGEGHRRGFLKLARNHLPPGTLFVWATPPALWWKAATLRWSGYGVLLALLLVLILWLQT